MKFLKRVLNFYITSSIHVAVAVCSLVWITLIEFKIPFDRTMVLFVFYASITGYNFVKYFSIAKFYHRRLAVGLKWIQVLSFVCFCLMCYYLWQLHFNTLLWIAVLGCLTFFYAMPYLPKKISTNGHKNLRSIVGVKVYIIALSWVGVTVFLPIINNDYIWSADVFLVAIQRFLFVLVLMLPFEIRDLQFDSLKLGTIPQEIGVKKTKLLGGMLLAAMFFLECFKGQPLIFQTLSLLTTIVVTFLLLLFSKKEQGAYYSAFWVEAVPVLWLILLLLFT
ncbi:hypothetical protein APS56_06585 [Pseudalgibacter alginicilyticus]|uniref:Prenyltransferase n=1 Tax=Pseudalgibacter alginicilyticus TaxID=1736674 RepID=A0A0N7HYB7_9FLAO|nr:hypothetical protein [Pseudalgibacter alginicilyticus]ALJ04806.1 hypothetical protein APS56_06585 [Pseudalgibacter alginicilyticus]